MGKKKEDWSLLPSKRRGNSLLLPRGRKKKSSKMLKTKGSQAIPWKLRNPSIFRGAHRTPIVAMEKSASGKTRRKLRPQYLTP